MIDYAGHMTVVSTICLMQLACQSQAMACNIWHALVLTIVGAVYYMIIYNDVLIMLIIHNVPFYENTPPLLHSLVVKELFIPDNCPCNFVYIIWASKIRLAMKPI